MTRIVLDEGQAALLADAREPIQICDAAGNVLGFAEPIFSRAEIEEAKRRAATPGKWFTTEQVLRHLDAKESK